MSSLADVNPPADPAADWAARMEAGPLSAMEKHALSAWLEESPNNRSRIEAYRRLHGRIETATLALASEGRLAEISTSPGVRVLRPVFRRTAIGLAAAAAITLSALWWFHRPQAYETPIARRQSLELADGTHVDLNARTVMAVWMRKGERRILLKDGEAFFAVAKDPSRPFYVETPAGTVRVTGTRFNVRADQPSELQVTVLEGSVAVNAKSATATYSLNPSDQLTVDSQTAAVRHLASADNAVAWRAGNVFFESEPLASAAETFAHYNGRVIEVDPEVAHLELGGRYKLEDVDRFLTELPQTVPVKVLRLENGVVRITAVR
jgi:transmembrane sensor